MSRPHGIIKTFDRTAELGLEIKVRVLRHGSATEDSQIWTPEVRRFELSSVWNFGAKE